MVQNLYIKADHHEKLIFQIPPLKVLKQALRESIRIQWKGTYQSPSDVERTLLVDKIEQIDYKLVSKSKIGHESTQYDEVASYRIEDKFIMLSLCPNCADATSQYAKIVAYSVGNDNNIND